MVTDLELDIGINYQLYIRYLCKTPLYSIGYVSQVGYTDVSICPTRIAPHTVVSELAKRGLYQPPSLWTVVDILRKSAARGVRVACLDVDGRDEDTIYPRNCSRCTPMALEALKRFNAEKDLSLLDELECLCHQDYLTSLETCDNRPLDMRVRDFIHQYYQEMGVIGVARLGQSD